MITNQVIQSCIDDLRAITRIELSVFDDLGELVATTLTKDYPEQDLVLKFARSHADSQVIGIDHLLKISENGELQYVIVARGVSDDTYMIGKIAAGQISRLTEAYRERYDRGNFFQNLLIDNLLLVDIYNQARRFHIEITCPRVVFLIELPEGTETTATEVIRGIFSEQTGDTVTTVEENNLILIKSVSGEELQKEVETVANTIVDMMGTEIMVNVRVSYGSIVQDIKDVSKSYKEAKMAMDVGKIFYAQKKVIAYATLGIGRLIYQLPVNLCRLFIQEIFGDTIPEFKEETIHELDTFFENNLNVSETSRKLFLHRNTLVYHMERIKEAIGLDLRTFDDALTFKIAMMVVKYMNYLDNQI